jgi:hypothetical protein
VHRHREGERSERDSGPERAHQGQQLVPQNRGIPGLLWPDRPGERLSPLRILADGEELSANPLCRNFNDCAPGDRQGVDGASPCDEGVAIHIGPRAVHRRSRGRRRSVGRGVRRLGQRAAKQMSSWVSTLSRKEEDNTAHRASASGVPAQRGPETPLACAYALCPGTGRSGSAWRASGRAGKPSRA